MIKNLLSKRIIKSSLLGIIMAVVFAVSFALASIPLGSNFQLNSQLPLDARTVVADTAARDAIPSGQRYRGLTVYVLSDATNYQLQAGITNGDWIALADAGGSMIYPGAGIAVSNGSSWGSSITNNSANWNTAYGWGNHASAGYVTGTPWTGMGYITDGNTGWDNSYGFITSLNGAVLTDQSTPQTVGDTTNRLSKLWVDDIDLTGNIVLPTTVDATSGVIYKGADRFIHNFALPGTDGFNTFVGINAGNLTMTGSTGFQGSNNTGIGYLALTSNTTGYSNTSLGRSSLRYNTTGVSNTASGFASLRDNTTGSYNTAVGNVALWANTTGSYNTAIGNYSLYLNTTGEGNAALGHFSLEANTTGSANSAFGRDTLSSNTTGSNNTATGMGALYYNITGEANSAVGHYSLNRNFTGSYNTAFGDSTLYDLGVGKTAGEFNIGTSYTIVSVGDTDWVAIGATSNTEGEVFTATGVGSGTGTAYPNNINNNTAIGYNTGRGIITGINNTILGANVIGLPPNLSNTVIIADGLGNKFAHNFGLSGTDGNNTFVGMNSGNFTMTGSTGVFGSDNTGIGYLTFSENTTGYRNTAVGNTALNQNTTGLVNTAMGYGALYSNTTGVANVAVGAFALYAETEGQANVAVGRSALRFTTTGVDNVAVGYYALLNNTISSLNTAIGTHALESNTIGSSNVAIGNLAGHNLLVPLLNNTNSTFIGASANSSVDEVENSMALGYLAQVTKSNQVVIGNTNITETLLRANVGIGTTAPTQALDVLGSIALPTTVDATSGVIYKGVDPFIHNFALPGTDGNNTFVGIGAGNFTMTGSTGSEGSENTGIGYLALTSNTTGYRNTAVGRSALRYNTTGYWNSAFGLGSLRMNTTGYSNTAFGEGTLNNSTTGVENTVIGSSALLSNITGNANSSVGYASLIYNETGSDNVAFGPYALGYNVTGNRNIAIGKVAFNYLGTIQTAGGFDIGTSYTIRTIGTTDFTAIGAGSNTVGEVFIATGVGSGDGTAIPNNVNNNTAIGYNTGAGIISGANNTILGANVDGLPSNLSNTVILANGNGEIFAHNFALPGTDGFNTFVGMNSGNFTMTGSVGPDGTYNVGIGSNALLSNTTGYVNTAVGANALYHNTTGSANTGLGERALSWNTTGQNNTAGGYASLAYNTTGMENTAFGFTALNENTTGNYNTATGFESLDASITGDYNTSNGYRALVFNRTGSNNTAFGATALYDLGGLQDAGTFNVGTSYTVLVVGDTDWVAIGATSNTEGEVFTATGVGSGTGQAAANNINNNTAIGYNTGRGIFTGLNNTIIGANVTGLSANLSNNIIIADGSGNRRVNVDANGNVGVGTISPAELLSLGNEGTLKGVLSFAGLTSGKVIIQPADVAGSYTLTLPTALGSAGQVLTDVAGDGVLSWTSSGGGFADPMTTAGDIIIRDATNVTTRLVAGGAGQVLTSDGTNISWEDPAGVSGAQTPWLSDINAAGYTLFGNNTASGNLTLDSTSDGTKGNVLINPTGGNVGVGITVPEGMLHVYKAQVANGDDFYGPDLILTRFWGSNTDTRAASIYNYYNNTTANDQLVFGVTGDGGATTNPSLYTNAKMVIQANGNVGIGTTIPAQKLDVAGNINISASSAYMYDGTNVIRAIPTSDDYFFGNSGNLTMTGGSNLAMGGAAFSNNTTGEWNVAFGTSSLLLNTTGNNNIAIGLESLNVNTTGTSNIAIGVYALKDLDITDGSGNDTAIGTNTGRGIVTGINNTIIGANVVGLDAALSNNIIIADGEGNRRINVDNLGNIGIGGVTSPLQALEIGNNGGIGFSGASPSINSSDKKLYSSVDGALEWFTNSAAGDHAFRISDQGTVLVNLDISGSSYFNGGNVGIGTATPTEILDIDGGIHIFSATPNNTSMVLYNNAGTLTWNGVPLDTGGSSISGTTNYIPVFTSASSLGDSVLYQDTGNIGIGTVTPGAQLEVAGDILLSIGGSRTITIPVDSGGTQLTVKAGNGLCVGDCGTVGGNLVLSGGDTSGGIVSLGGDVYVYGGVGGTDNGDVVLAYDGLGVIGNVGIGTMAPSQILDVVGNINISADSAYMYGGTNIITAQPGNKNYFIGSAAGSLAMTGGSNLAFGYSSLPSNTTGVNNIAIGAEALLFNTTGYQNVAIGTYALYDLNITADDGSGNNTAIGYNTGWGIVTGVNNTIIGANVVGLDSALSNNIIIADGEGNRRINVDNLGNVGIGTTAPTAQLEVFGTSNKLALTYSTGIYGNVGAEFNADIDGNLHISARENGPSVIARNILLADGGGRVGVGNNAPSTLLTVGTDITNTGDITVYGTGTTCIIGDGTGGTSCTSDLRLKENIIDLESELTNIMALRPVTFNWKNKTRDQVNNMGLIAQEVQSIYPNIVRTIYDDYLGIDYTTLVVPAIKAIQELNLNLEGIAGTITPLPGSLNETFVTTFFNNIKTTIGTWLADATNGIGNMFADVFNAKEKICIDGECLTKDDVRALLLLVHPDGNPQEEEIVTDPIPVEEVPIEDPTPAEDGASEEIVTDPIPVEEVPTEEVPAEVSIPTEAEPAPQENPTP